MIEANPYFEEAAKKGGFYSEELMKQLAGGAHLSDIIRNTDRYKKDICHCP